MNATLKKIREIIAEPSSTLITQAQEDGYIPVGYTCSAVPSVLLSVDKLFPVRLRAPGVEGTELADIYLSNSTCSWCRSLLEYSMNDRYSFLQAWVFASSCDHMRRFYDNYAYLEKPDFFYMIDLARKSGPRAIQQMKKEYEKLCEALSSHFGIAIDNEALQKTILRENEKKKYLKEISELRKDENIILTGTAFHHIMLASSSGPWELVKPYIEEVKNSSMQGTHRGKPRARILLTGGMMDDPSFISVIESQNALVVADRFCSGGLPGLEEIPLTDDPLYALASWYNKNTFCPVMMENFESRFTYILETVEAWKIDGVVVEALNFCDMWGVETALLTRRLREEKIPVLRLGREYFPGGEGQMRTRVQAFLESMGR